jgi:hypothetical protein
MIVTVKRPPVNSSTVTANRPMRCRSRAGPNRNLCGDDACRTNDGLPSAQAGACPYWGCLRWTRQLRVHSKHTGLSAKSAPATFLSLDPCWSARPVSAGDRVCGAMRTTSHALRRCDDNMYCDDARGSYFIQLSSLRHFGAQHARHVPTWAWILGDGRGDRKGGRMKYYGTAPAFSIAPSNDPRLLCPQCQDLIIAATNSQHVSPNEVRHWWACEACGHEFCTTVRWESSPLQSVSAFEKTLA